MENNNLEVLSPAGSPENFYSAINAGADAIYLGLSSFNARMKAENFNEENIFDFVNFAHKFGVKIYITLNTLVCDDDFEKVISLVDVLVKAKVDAFIVQDFGIAKLLKTCYKNIILHASTQMGIHNLDGAKMAEKMGITRIVLSRETKLEDIKQIKQNTNLEIEYFVQGALCVAFSGNCYLSSLEKNMSGNEGKCLQLCRLPYTNSLTNENSYSLSARDLSLLESLPELIEAGVTSFKIEGRMRHAGYSAITTKIYKEAINLILNNKFTTSWAKSQEQILRETFSRGEFNKRAYLDTATPNNIINKDYQNHIGVKIGSVLSVAPFKNELYKVKISSIVPINSGDGIKIINEKTKEQVASLGIGNVTKINNTVFEFVTKYKFPSGLSVFLTQNKLVENEFLSAIRKVKINFYIEAFANKNLLIKASTNTSSVDYTSEFVLEKAKNAPLFQDDFYAQFNKLDNTIFEIDSFEVKTDGVFLPKSMLNNIRRNIVEMLDSKCLKTYAAPNAIFDEESFNKLKNTKINVNPKNIAIIDENFDFENDNKTLDNFDIVVLSPAVYTIEKIMPIYEKLNYKFALNLPTILNHNDKLVLNKILSALPKNIYLFANNLYGANYADEYNVILSPMLNIKNKFAISLFIDYNISTICASVEASEDFITQNNLVSFENGYFPLMTFAHCPIKTIYNSSCQNCKYSENFNLLNQNLGNYKVARTKVSSCYFALSRQIFKKKLKFSLINLSKY